jgi:hypothetical protein
LFPFRVLPEERRWLVLLALLALVQSAALFVLGFRAAGGHFMLPLDDAYIHLQYARMAAAGQPLVYTPGAAPSGGMTSPLHVATLLPPFLAGMAGVRAALWAALANSACWVLATVWLFQLVRRLAPVAPSDPGMASTIAGTAALLHLTSGFLLWNFHSGMETGLFITLVLGIVLAAAVWWGEESLHARRLLLLLLALLPLARPEGVMVTLALLAIVLARRGEQPSLPLLGVLVTLLPFGLWLAVLAVMTGDWRPAGLVVKGLGANPWLDLPGRLAMAGDTLSSILGRFLSNRIPSSTYAAFRGEDFMPYLVPGLGHLGLLGAGWALATEWQARRPAAPTLLALAALLLLASPATSTFPFSQHQRYLAPAIALLLPLAVLAVWRLAQCFHLHTAAVFRGTALVLILASLPGMAWWTAEHGRNGRDIFHLLRAATFRIPAGGPPFAVTDAGVLAYYTNRQIDDLVGLGSREFTRLSPMGDGAVLAGLARIPWERRPAHLATYRHWFPPAFPLGPAEWEVAIPRNTITSGNVLGWYPIDWDAIDGRLPAAPWGTAMPWLLDVGDPVSEAARAYRHVVPVALRRAHGWPNPLTPVLAFHPAGNDAPTTAPLAVDNGRLVAGESFALGPLRVPPGQQAVLHLRLATADRAIAGGVATRLNVAVVSNTTGYRATRAIGLTGDPNRPRVYTLPLSAMMREAGGTAWTVDITPEPVHGAWVSLLHHVLLAPAGDEPLEEPTP